jgi:hypothetical protein
MIRAEQIHKALELLAPVPDQRDECRRSIEHALGVMDSTTRTAAVIKAQRTANRQTGRAYHAMLERMLTASKAHARAGGALAIPIPDLERVVESATEWDAKFARALPRGAIAKRQATALAYNLLRQWDRPTPTTRGGAWHTLAAILIGDRGADLFRQLREFQLDLS